MYPGSILVPRKVSLLESLSTNHSAGTLEEDSKFFSFWWNHTRSPENFKGGSVRHGSVGHGSVRGCNPPEGSPEGVPFSEASSPRAKRGRPAERSEAPPSEARLRRAKRGRAKVIGRSPLQKNSKRFHQKAQGNHLFTGFYRGPEKSYRLGP